MKAYIQSHENGIPHNYNFMNASQGFYEMGFEVIPFHDNERFQESNKEDIVVGYVGTVRARLADFGINDKYQRSKDMCFLQILVGSCLQVRNAAYQWTVGRKMTLYKAQRRYAGTRLLRLFQVQNEPLKKSL